MVTALFNDAAAKDAIDVAFSALLPQVSLQGQTFQQNNAGARNSQTNGYQVVAQVSVPVFQGGSEYSAVRQARQSEQQTQRLIDDARRTAVQNAVQAWDTLIAAKASADSTRAQIRANEVALEGTEREAIVGSRTTLDVLNATQLLLQSRTTLVQNLAQVITASYAVAAAIGRLTARDLHLAGATLRRHRLLPGGEGSLGGPRRLCDRSTRPLSHARRHFRMTLPTVFPASAGGCGWRRPLHGGNPLPPFAAF